MRVEFTSTSKRDLQQITEFIASDNAKRAESFVAELVEACLGLAEFPLRYAVLHRYASRGYRRRPLGEYAIIYVISPDRIQIIRVISAWRDLDDSLN